jgi:hypothetical protein
VRIALATFNFAPPGHPTLKYEGLGPAAGRGLRAYCARHGYAAFDAVPDLAGRHACWGKIPALRAALADHDWAFWVDSDALVTRPDQRLETLITADADLVAQQPEPWFARTRLDLVRGWAMQPVNTGVFGLRRTDWSLRLLEAAEARARPEAPGQPWDGRGDQEAICEVLADWGLDRVAHAASLQTPPGGPPALFSHLFGDRAQARYPADVCRAVVATLVSTPAPLLARRGLLELLHWCAIQNLDPEAPLHRGGPERFGYVPQALDRALASYAAPPP